MGSNHGVAICEWEPKTNVVYWRGAPTEISIPKKGWLSLQQLVDVVDQTINIQSNKNIVIGVDAPLGYPKEFVRLLHGKTKSMQKPEKEIYNPLAYRYTDQVIYSRLGKKPLSAAFDRIGNNASVAMFHTQLWEKEHNFKIEPFGHTDNNHDRFIIETYPALAKETQQSAVNKSLRKYLPSYVKVGTDAYDACICALYAVAYRTDGALLPKLEHPPEHAKQVAKEEGWIYYFS
nr:DUF429 domain-containing protein [Geomicrobium halophilum]